jgi:hypothetical protein
LILRQQQGVRALLQESLDRLQIDAENLNNRLPLTRRLVQNQPIVSAGAKFPIVPVEFFPAPLTW